MFATVAKVNCCCCAATGAVKSKAATANDNHREKPIYPSVLAAPIRRGLHTSLEKMSQCWRKTHAASSATECRSIGISRSLWTTALSYAPICPSLEGRHPVILSYGPYAKGLSFKEGYVSAWERLTGEHPEVLASSSRKQTNWEVVDPERWVPDGYACLRIDSRGAGRSPGYLDRARRARSKTSI